MEPGGCCPHHFTPRDTIRIPETGSFGSPRTWLPGEERVKEEKGVTIVKLTELRGLKHEEMILLCFVSPEG